ncbi:molybdopterin molybdotransferase MoeA [Streptomyces sp. Da 82-17]|uniref:molybdopterin molybdotransferase MoeA n=1 Tax=Streptomyces sp. Da 82-17 TaxID=3377116 RepID=UPI0038D4EEF5
MTGHGHGHGHGHGYAPTWSEARRRARDCAEPLPAVTLPSDGTLGHALAAPLTALTDLPPFDTSAMDGWAVAGPGPWHVGSEAVLAGDRPALLAEGSAVAIATGARLPVGATSVLRREHGELAGRSGTLHDRSGSTEPVPPGRDIRPRGQECGTGDLLLPAGATVTPSALGLAAAAGYDTLAVHRRPTVELLVLGDELLHSGPPRDGRIRDALGPLLPPWLHSLGADVTSHRTVMDDPTRLAEAIRESPVDFLHPTLRAAGARLLVDSVAVRPGHPMLLAELPPHADGRARRLVGLPGNPLAAVAGVLTLAAPLLRRLGGHAAAAPLHVRAGAALPGHPTHTRLLPVRRAGDAVLPLPFGGPAMLRGLALADGLAVVPPGGAQQGTAVELLPVPGQRPAPGP